MPDIIKVGIVEDNHDTRQALALLINGSPGFRCVAACVSAEEALREMPVQRPEVILMDIQLPGMSGIQCIRELKAALPEAQVLMLTVLEDHQRIFSSLAAGASGYIIKKTSSAKLLEAVADAHQGGAPMSSQIARLVVESFRHTEDLPALKTGRSPSEAGARLSPRERQILDKLSQGFLYKEIAAALGISIGTVRVHIRNIYEKLQARNRVEAVNIVYGR